MKSRAADSWLPLAREIIRGAYLPAEIPREQLFDKEAEAQALADWLRISISPKLAAKALRSIKSESRVEASKENGKLGGAPRKLPRKCEVCGHEWKSKWAYDWILVCPKCKISGYHMPSAN